MNYSFFWAFSIFTFSFLTTSGQQNHFIYFQTENKQPFYVKLDNKILTSSATGYLILPKLKDGEYEIKFGSTKNEWPEQEINYTLNKDAGFIFKNFGDKGWGLFNLQSLDIILGGNNTPANKPAQEIKDDDFSKMLANVVNDSTIKEKDLAIKEEKKETPKEIKTPVETVPEASPQEIETPKLTSVIKRNLRKKNKDGMELIYTDEYNTTKDTIRIFIPVEKIIKKNEIKHADTTIQTENKTDSNNISSIDPVEKINNQSDSSQNVQLKALVNEPVSGDHKNDTTESSSGITSEPSVKDTLTPVVRDSLQNVAQKNETVKEDKLEFLPAESGKLNPDCKEYANEDDFLKLRRKMVAESNEDNMIKVAKKAFKTKCFTTDYIKNLSALFLKDQAKYNFFDAAYPYVSDSSIFSSLENQLSDAYYIKRFKAMIHQ